MKIRRKNTSCIEVLESRCLLAAVSEGPVTFTSNPTGSSIHLLPGTSSARVSLVDTTLAPVVQVPETSNNNGRALRLASGGNVRDLELTFNDPGFGPTDPDRFNLATDLETTALSFDEALSIQVYQYGVNVSDRVSAEFSDGTAISNPSNDNKIDIPSGGGTNAKRTFILGGVWFDKVLYDTTPGPRNGRGGPEHLDDFEFTIDSVPTTPTISGLSSYPFEPLSLLVTFSEPIDESTFQPEDFLILNGTVNSIHPAVGIPNGYEIRIQPNGLGRLTIDLREGSVLEPNEQRNFSGTTFQTTIFQGDDDPPLATRFARQSPVEQFTSADELVFHATFNEPLRNVDASDFRVAGGASATITVVPVQGTGETVFRLTLSGGNLASHEGTVGIDLSPSGNITDVAGNPLRLVEPAVDEIYSLDHTAPTIEDVNVADGNHSIVKSIDITFSEIVEIDQGAFEVTNQTVGGTAEIEVTQSIENGKTIAQLRFRGPLVNATDSLINGVYQLVSSDSNIRDGAGNSLDGDADGVPGAPRTDEFFRLFGDINGDRAVLLGDFSVFRSSFGSSVGDPSYRPQFDSDQNGMINLRDFAEMRASFGEDYRPRPEET